MVFYYLIIFVFGLIAGSFLNCLVYRLETGQRMTKRSYCPYCRNKLSWQDLIPVLSFIILKGKCRYCHKKISLQYPLVDLSTGLLFLLIFNFQFPVFNEFSIVNFQNLINLCFMLCVSCFMIVIFLYDLKHYIIPDKVIYPAIAITFLYQSFRVLNFGFLSDFSFRTLDFETWTSSLLAGIIACLFFLTIVVISQGKWMGMGDVKLAFLMGLFLGFPNILVALFFAFFIGAIIGIGLIAVKKKTLKSELPFGPFLVIGTFIALFWGERIINWYLGLCSVPF